MGCSPVYKAAETRLNNYHFPYFLDQSAIDLLAFLAAFVKYLWHILKTYHQVIAKLHKFC